MTQGKSSIVVTLQISGCLIFLTRATDISMKVEQTCKPIKSSSCLQQRPNREPLLCRTIIFWSRSNKKAALSCAIQADESKSILVPYLQPAQSKTGQYVPKVNADDGERQLNLEVQNFFLKYSS